jgi:hypothetical protein
MNDREIRGSWARVSEPGFGEGVPRSLLGRISDRDAHPALGTA